MTELTVTSQGIILRGNRIVIPQTLQQRAVDIAHEAHLGIEKTKALIREKIWFPKINNVVKDKIGSCIVCQAFGRQKPPEPLAMTQMPKRPWEILHVDFYGPLPSSEYLLVVTDRYSRFPEVEIVHSTKISAVVPKLYKIFAVHGIPDVVKSDNEPPFKGEEYRQYLRILGIKAEFSTPLWPQGNAQVERFMQPLGKALKTATIEGRPWRQELSRFLFTYRNTPHSTTEVPPAELLFNRTVKGKLPILERENVVDRHQEARAREDTRQKYNKQYSDERRNTRKSEIKIGDHVLVKQKKRKKKLSANFNKTPHIVTHRDKTVTPQNRNGHVIRRNVSHKWIPKHDTDTYNEDITEDHVYENNNDDNNRVYDDKKQ